MERPLTPGTVGSQRSRPLQCVDSLLARIWREYKGEVAGGDLINVQIGKLNPS